MLACSLWFLLCGCEGKKKFPDTPNYKLSEPRVIPLPTALDEISGIAYYPPDTSVFAIIDEAGTLFKISLNDPQQIRQWSFDKKRDYEELVLIDSTFYVLVSKGDIVSIRFEGDSSIATKSDFGEGGKSKNEFESMIYIGNNKLVIICKECKDDSKEVLSSYTYNISENVYTPFIQFDLKQILNDRQMKGRFKPSGAAIHPFTKDIYIISSINKSLMITDSAGRYKASYELNPNLYKQPEGITFTPEGHMIISNEFADEGFGELLLFKNMAE